MSDLDALIANVDQARRGRQKNEAAEADRAETLSGSIYDPDGARREIREGEELAAKLRKLGVQFTDE